MPITTCIDMITAALLTAGVNGVGQTPMAEDAQTGFDLLLEVIELWKRERFLAWRNTEAVIPSTGAQSYPMLDRPPRLDSAFARLMVGAVSGSVFNAGPLDFPLTIIDSQEDYNAISLKSLTTFPAGVWYSPDYPTGTLWFWPIPPANQFELHAFYRAGLPTYTQLTDPLNLPREYIRALRYELALLLQLNYGLPANPAHAAALAGTKAQIKAVNAHVRESSMPAALVPMRGGQGGLSGAVGPHQSVIVLDSGNAVLG